MMVTYNRIIDQLQTKCYQIVVFILNDIQKVSYFISIHIVHVYCTNTNKQVRHEEATKIIGYLVAGTLGPRTWLAQEPSLLYL